MKTKGSLTDRIMSAAIYVSVDPTPERVNDAANIFAHTVAEYMAIYAALTESRKA